MASLVDEELSHMFTSVLLMHYERLKLDSRFGGLLERMQPRYTPISEDIMIRWGHAIMNF